MGCGCSSTPEGEVNPLSRGYPKPKYLDSPSLASTTEEEDMWAFDELSSYHSQGRLTDEGSAFLQQASRTFKNMKSSLLHGINSDPNQFQPQEEPPLSTQHKAKIVYWIDCCIIEVLHQMTATSATAQQTQSLSHSHDATTTTSPLPVVRLTIDSEPSRSGDSRPTTWAGELENSTTTTRLAADSMSSATNFSLSGTTAFESVATDPSSDDELATEASLIRLLEGLRLGSAAGAARSKSGAMQSKPSSVWLPRQHLDLRLPLSFQNRIAEEVEEEKERHNDNLHAVQGHSPCDAKLGAKKGLSMMTTLLIDTVDFIFSERATEPSLILCEPLQLSDIVNNTYPNHCSRRPYDPEGDDGEFEYFCIVMQPAGWVKRVAERRATTYKEATSMATMMLHVLHHHEQ